MAGQRCDVTLLKLQTYWNKLGLVPPPNGVCLHQPILNSGLGATP